MIEGQAQATARNPFVNVLRLRDFRLLWAGQATSWLGDQFSFIALPWLVLQLTHDPLALGVVLAVGGFPQAVATLIGGALADRRPPRKIMLASDAVRFALTALLAALILTGAIQLWMLLAIALVSGSASGLFSPASGALIPALVPRERLQAANSLSQGTLQVATLIGPALAGATIALLGNSLNGIGIAFGVDAATFLISVVTLSLVRAPSLVPSPIQAGHMLTSLAGGLRFAWNDPLLRLLFTILIANNLLIGGALAVGLPVMADLQLPEKAAALGLVTAALSGGSLIGVLLSGGLRRRIKTSHVGIFAVAFFGAGLIALAFVEDTFVAMLLMAALGVAGGYVSVILPTLLQKRTPADFLGRVMGIFYFSNLGLAPISRALAGGVVRIGLFALFGGAGVLLLLLALWIVRQGSTTLMDEQVERHVAFGV